MGSLAMRRLRADEVLGWSVFAVCVLLLGYGLSQHVARMLDFQEYYAAGHLLRSSPAHLYDLNAQWQVEHALIGSGRFMPFYHLSYEAPLYIPLSFLSYGGAYLAQMAWNLFLLAMVYMVAPEVKSPALRRVPRMLLFFGFVPVLFCLWEGQNSILFLLLLCGVWRCVESEQPAMAGVLLALGLFKLPITVIVAAVLCVRLGWRFVAGFAVTSAGVALACVGVAGVSGVRAMVELMQRAGAAPDQGAGAQFAMSVVPLGAPNLNGVLYLFGMRGLGARAALEVHVLLAAVIVVGCALLARRASLPWAFCIAVMGGLVAGQHVGLHDAVIQLLPVLMIDSRFQKAWVAVAYAVPLAVFANPAHLIAADGIVSMLFLAGAAYQLMQRPGTLEAAATAV